MDSSRGSQAGGKAEPRQQAQPSYEPFHPPTGWAQDKEKHILLVHLPGFNKEDIRVQVDNSGKLTVTGTKKVGEGRYMRVEETFQVPKTSSIEKISGTFEDGLLRLTMLKVAPDQEEPPKTIPSDEKKKAAEEKEAPQKMIPSEDEKKKAAQEKEAPKKTISSEDEKKKAIQEKEALQKTIPSEDEKKKAAQEKEAPKKTIPSEDEKKKAIQEKEAPQKTIPSEDEKKKAIKEKEAPQKMISSVDEKKKEVEEKGAIQKMIPSEDKKKKALEEKEEPQKMIHEKKKEVEEPKKEEEPVHKKRKQREDEGFFETRIGKGKEGKFRKDREEGWLDYELVDNLLEMINKNRKVIAVAVVAFSVGFYVSHKLRSSGR